MNESHIVGFFFSELIASGGYLRINFNFFSTQNMGVKKKEFNFISKDFDIYLEGILIQTSGKILKLYYLYEKIN